MANYKEIMTKAIIGKGKKTFINTGIIMPEVIPERVLGCWVVNNIFSGNKVDNQVIIDGSFDVNIWYSCSNNTSTEVVRQNVSYRKTINIRRRDNELSNETINVRSLSQPLVTKTNIVDNKIEYTVSNELGIELVGDTMIKIEVEDAEVPWDDIIEETINTDQVMNEIDEQVNEEYIQENI